MVDFPQSHDCGLIEGLILRSRTLSALRTFPQSHDCGLIEGAGRLPRQPRRLPLSAVSRLRPN